jgi:YHS domain-containing protein
VNSQGLATTDRQTTPPQQNSGGLDRQTASPNADLQASKDEYNTRTEKNATRTQPQSPAASLDGYCPVTLLTKEQWKKGSPALGAIHRGRLFLFTGDKEKKMFLANPDKFSPVLAGVDPVELTERGEVLEGKRAHGVVYRSQVFLFVSEANLEKFWGSPESYTATILQAMQSSGDGTMYR